MEQCRGRNRRPRVGKRKAKDKQGSKLTCAIPISWGKIVTEKRDPVTRGSKNVEEKGGPGMGKNPPCRPYEVVMVRNNQNKKKKKKSFRRGTHSSAVGSGTLWIPPNALGGTLNPERGNCLH